MEILAAELSADLITVGSRGLSGVERFLLGSTSDELVVSARTSVLVVRT
jgi:nucleotide-binding universal stress UspA family protein